MELTFEEYLKHVRDYLSDHSCVYTAEEHAELRAAVSHVLMAYGMAVSVSAERMKDTSSTPSVCDIKLEPVTGSTACQFSAIENKLVKLYNNQEQLLKAIKLIGNRLVD